MKVKNQPIYTHNMGLTESEFLRREFSLTLTELSGPVEKKIIESSLFHVATTDPLELESLLQDCRTKSAVIFFFGNETYDIPQAQWLNKYNNKIKFAFIYNLPIKTPFIITLKCLMGAIKDGGLLFWEGERNLLRNFKNGIDLMKRTRELTLNFPYLDFPQGYSQRFVSEIKLAGIDIGESSILDHAPLIISDKNKKISFTGQSGSWCRELAIRVLTKIDIEFVPTYTHGWGGLNQGKLTSYVDSLIRSEFTLTPPGNLTNRTYRYLESLIFNSVPIMPPSTLQDPHLWGAWSESIKPMYFSWKGQINRALKLSSDEREIIVFTALLEEKRKVKKINAILGNIDKYSEPLSS
jgi:hypothetical protein